MRTRFTPDGDDVLVNGSKRFITNGDVADRLLLFGKWSDIEKPRKAISVLILEKGTPGFSVSKLRVEDGIKGLVHGRACIRRLPRAACQRACGPGRRFTDPAGVVKPFAPSVARTR